MSFMLQQENECIVTDVQCSVSGYHIIVGLQCTGMKPPFGAVLISKDGNRWVVQDDDPLKRQKESIYRRIKELETKDRIFYVDIRRVDHDKIPKKGDILRTSHEVGSVK